MLVTAVPEEAGLSGPAGWVAHAAKVARSPWVAPWQAAREYDEWYLGQGLFAQRERPGWGEEVARVIGLAGSLGPDRRPTQPRPRGVGTGSPRR